MPFIWTDIARKLVEIFTTPPKELPPEWQKHPLRVNEEGWLEGDEVKIIKAHPSWHYSKLSTPTGDPLALVWHVSATKLGTAEVMANNRIHQFRPKKPEHTKEDAGKLYDRAASWHISVESNKVVQMISLEAGAWHAVNGIKGVGPANRTSIGIELVGYEAGPWPEEQVANAARVARAIIQSYGIKRELAQIQHATIDPKDRTDPGKEWMTKHMQRVMDFCYA
jgi:hypothetical protein